jgi:MFS family permease
VGEGESGRGGDGDVVANPLVSPSPPLPFAPSAPSATDERPHERRNFWLLVAYQIVLRTGWIFKTESVVMPVAADALDPSGFARGWLPLLNRIGQSVPPVLAARRLKNQRKKKRAFIATTAAMTLCFLGLTSLWLIPGLAGHDLAAIIFLVLYALFFAAIGVNNLAYTTIQGKLIRVTWRGRLLTISDFVGASSAMICAVTLLPMWLHEDSADYAAIFGFTTALFAAASVMSWFLKEQPDDHYEPPRGVRHVFRAAWRTLVEDANFRRLAVVSALFSTTLVLFPHYQAIARDELALDTTWLVWWVFAQNGGTALFSLLTGPIADAYGNRLSLRILTLLVVIGPLAALAAIYFPTIGRVAFPLVFVFIGMTPVAQKTFNNYTLEISEPQDHPRYLSTLSLCMAAPLLASPLISPLINAIGFEAVYLFVVCLLLLGWLMTFRLSEPRAAGRPVVLAEDSITE